MKPNVLVQTPRSNRLCRLGAALAVPALLVGQASAAIDIAEAETAITTAEGYVTTLGGAAIGLAVLFLTVKLVRRAISKV